MIGSMVKFWRYWNEPVVLVSEWCGRLAQALEFVWWFGIASVFLDLDHVLVLVAKGLPVTWHNLARQAGRPLHIPALVFSGLVCLICGAYFVRLLANVGTTRSQIVKVQ